MNISKMQQDSDNADKNGMCTEAKFIKQTTMIGKPSGIVNNSDERSRGVLSEDYFVNVMDLDDILEKIYIKEENDTLKIPGVKTLGEKEKKNCRENYTGAETADKAAILEESGLGTLEVAKTTFEFNMEKSQVKDHITHSGVSGHFVDPWKKDAHLNAPAKEDIFSIHSISRQTEQSAHKVAERTCSIDHIAGKGQHEEQLAPTTKGVQKKEACVVSEENFSGSLNSRKAETDEANWKEVTDVAFESSSKCCRNECKSLQTNVMIKPCYVILENINHEIKEKHKYSLMHPNAKKLPQQTQNNRADVIKKMHIALYDLLEKSRIKKLRKPLQIQNAKALKENATEKKVENSLGLNSSPEVLSSDIVETNTNHNVEKTESKHSCPDISSLCDVGIFARFSFMESGHGNYIGDFCHVQEDAKRSRNLQVDSFFISETQEVNTRSFECGEMFMKNRSKLVKKAEREEISCRIEEHPNLKMFASRVSGESANGNTSQSSRINQTSLSCEEILETNILNSTCSSATLLNEAKFCKGSLRRMDAVFPLLDTADEEGNECQTTCEFESHCVSSLSGDDVELDLKDRVPSKTEIRMSIEREMILPTINELAEEVVQEQLDVEEQETLNQSTSTSTKNACWFLLEMEEVIEVENSTCTTNEQCVSTELRSGDLLDHGTVFLEQESKSECQALPGIVTNIKQNEIIKETVLGDHSETHDGEINVEESVNSQSAKENNPVGELSGPAVRLLGTISDNQEKFIWDRLIELKDSSDYEESQGTYPSNSLKEEKPRSADVVRCKPLCSDNNRADKERNRRPSKTPTSVHHSQLSQEQSRMKVVNAFREVLQKRLENFPDLSVQKNDVLRIATKLEREIYKLFCCVDQHYKKKYRSLLFNLKSTENQQLYCNVILGKITPKRLVQMTSLEMAPKELAEWRARENKRVLEMIEKEEREPPRCCPAKFTHKGIVEINRETDEDVTFQEILCGSQSFKEEKAPAAPEKYSTDNHWHHTSISHAGEITAHSERGFKPHIYKHTSKQKVDPSKYLHPSAMNSDERERLLQEDSPISPSIPKKRQRVEKQSRTAAVWAGHIQMFSVKTFAAKAHPVSGSNCCLFQALPHLLQSRGCILSEDVWDYLDSIWPANSKEMGVLRFQPSLSNGLSPYNRLYSYLNVKQRYGIVDSKQMEIFMVPLAAFQPVPSKLRPLGGPGLDPSHPSLLLALILPKRPPTGVLATRPNPLPKAKKKSVTFKDSVEIKCFALPSHSQENSSQMQPPQQQSGVLCGDEGPKLVLPNQEPLSADAVQALIEQLDREASCRDSSPVYQEEAGVETNQSLLDGIIQSLSGTTCTGGHFSSVTLEASAAQSHQAGDQVPFCISSDPSHNWNSLEHLPPSEPVYPDQVICEADGTNLFDSLFLPNMFCAEALPPCEVSHVPYTKPAAEDSSSLVEETLSLIQHVTQLQSHLQGEETQQPSAAVNFPITLQETVSALSQAVAGLECPPVEYDDGMHAQLQLLLSTFGDQTQPTPAI